MIDTAHIGRSGRLRRGLAVLLLACALVWVLSGIRRIDVQRSLAVLAGPLLPGGALRVEGTWAVAPPGWLRLELFPRQPFDLALPQAERALLGATSGGPCGLRGQVRLRVRADAWRRLQRAAGGGGVDGALLQAVRDLDDVCAGAPADGRLRPARLRTIEERLTAALELRGLDVEAVDLDALDFPVVQPGRAAPALTDSRVLVVGLDGADWAILDPLLAAGRLPHLARLIDEGVRADLLSISPLLSPVVWTSVATGVEPRRHGILDFLVDAPEGGQRQPVTSAQRRVPAVWEMLSEAGARVGVVGWWASWPADPVRGYLVSDRIAYQLFGYRADPADARGKTWPPDLYEEIRESIVAPQNVGWDRVRPYLGGARLVETDFDATEREMLEDFRTLLAAGDSHLRIALDLQRRHDPQLELVYFEGTDTVGHLFMPYRPPAQPGIDAARVGSFGPIVDRYYETADGYLGALLAERGPDWTVLVLSDHGFATDSLRPRSADSRIGHGAAADWHRRFGMLVLSGARIRRGRTIAEASVYDIAPTVLALFGQPVPRSWPGRVLFDALEPEFLAAHPVRYRMDDPRRSGATAGRLTDPAAAERIAKLQSLGYVSGGAGSATGDAVTARNNAGIALLAEGDPVAAEREFRAALEVSDEASMVLANLGLSLRLQGRTDEALRTLRQAAEDPRTLRHAGVQLAEMELDAGQPDAALGWVRRVLEREPDAAEAHNALGLIHEARGDLEQARQSWVRAAELDPRAAMPRNNLGNLEQRAGRLDEAERYYLAAIAADPYFMGAYNNLALVYQTRGVPERAIDLYDRALIKAPDHAVVLNNLASLQFYRGEVERARLLWERAGAADPTYPSPWNNLASIAITEERLDDAEQLLARALSLDPGYGDARINLALVRRRQGNLEAAREQLRQAAGDSRTGARAWMQLGLLELDRGRPADAAEALSRAVQRTPDSVDALNALGEALRRAGRPAQAAEAWRRSLELQPAQPAVRRARSRLQPPPPTAPPGTSGAN